MDIIQRLADLKAKREAIVDAINALQRLETLYGQTRDRYELSPNESLRSAKQHNSLVQRAGIIALRQSIDTHAPARKPVDSRHGHAASRFAS